MVGFLDKQFRMTGNTPGEYVNDYSTVTLKNGSVIIGYFAAGDGPMHFYRINARSGEIEFLSKIGQIGSGFGQPTLIANDDGGFSVIMQTEVGPSLDDQRLTKLDFDRNAVQQGSTDLDAGFMGYVNAIKTDAGFFVSYRDRHTDEGIEYRGAFYNNNGKLLNTYDFDEGRTGFARANPNATVLENGDIAVVWTLSDSDGTMLQIFRPNGTPVGGRKLVSSEGAYAEYYYTPELTQHPDGGFVMLSVRSADPMTINIQRFSGSGKKIGAEIGFDATIHEDIPSTAVHTPKVAFTKAGLMVVAWSSVGLSGNTGDSDVFMAVFSKAGNLLVGPMLASETAADGQGDVDFLTLRNGNLMLTFFDDTNVLWSHQASIQGRVLVDPDSIWEGNSSDNTKVGTNGDDVMLGLDGNDTISGGNGEDYIKGGRGDDSLNGGNHADVLEGEGGNDTLNGGKGNDQMFGGDGNDRMNGEAGGDQMYGGNGNDRLNGGGGNDILQGGNGRDVLLGGNGNDTLSATSGKNTMKGGAGNDTLTGGTGTDTLEGGSGNDALYGMDGNDIFSGGDGQDVLNGGEGRDILRGGSGNDTLTGGGGNDREYGGEGDDRFQGSKGNDKLFGEGGADSFVFYTTDFGKDVIMDFDFGVDVLDMGYVARALALSGRGEITVSDTKAGVLFSVDADNSVLVKGADLADFGPGDLILDSPF